MGSSRLAKTGTGTLTLSGQSTGFIGALVLQEGTLRAVGPNNRALGQGTLELNGGVLHLMNDASLSFGRNTRVGGDVSIIADRITSAATDINSGRVYAQNASSLGAAGSQVTVNGGNLELRHASVGVGRHPTYTNTATLSLTSNATVD